MKKTVLITGASSGIGKETARLFQKNGWNVIATMRSPENETDLAGLEHLIISRLDVQDQKSIEQAVAGGMDTFGRIDVLVNSAGYGLMGVFESSTHEQVQRQYAVNVLGLFDVTRAVLAHMQAQGDGCIINLSSVKTWFNHDDLIEKGLPDVGFFADRLHLSPNYLSDLLKRYTGRTTQEHIHLQITEKAKSLLWGTRKPVSEIAYELEFEHASHFNRIFKTKTGQSPTAFRGEVGMKEG